MAEDARRDCPLCGGELHVLARRCKHCKGVVTVAPVATVFRPKSSKPTVVEARPRHARWPNVLIAISALAVVISIGVVMWTSKSAAKREVLPATPAAPIARPVLVPIVPTPPPGDAIVAPPAEDDLSMYTPLLPKLGPLSARIDTRLGAITCELFVDQAPLAVANFVGLATGQKPWRDAAGKVQTRKPYYDGLVFHRVIPEFMIQGGDPQGTGTGGPGYKFANEQNDLVMEPGSLAMANAGPDTNGSQFFIMEKAAPWLDGKHTIFGKCEDVDIVKEIARVSKDSRDKPTDPVTMTVTITN